ncbi:MAG: hypothetical protein FVQ85_01270 [Planctomycetes bacterium]|nr:hypothetical protein [Planctomycetota bacterium]
MAQRKKLSKKQLSVMDNMFTGELDEQAVLDRHKVSRNVYSRWLADGLFVTEFDRRIMSAHRQSAALIARYAPLAAAKLVHLTESEKEETARKACLDIISLQALLDKRIAQPSQSQTTETQPQQQLTEQAASRLLAALAQEEQ